MYHSTRKKVHILLHPELGETKWDKIINAFIIFLIISNVLVVILETVPWIHDKYLTFFYYFDLISVIIFTIEYVLRVWSCDHDPRYSHTFFGRLKYMFSYEGLIDLVAILPFYVHVVVGLDLRVLRMLRLLRFLRLFRLTAYMKSAKMIRNVFVKRASDLKLSVVLILILIIIASSVMYFAEHNAQPTVFSSIPATLWYAIVTLTTVGFGDITPQTPFGQFIASIIMILGYAIIAIPTGIVSSEMTKNNQEIENNTEVCPNCAIEHHKENAKHCYNCGSKLHS